MKNTVQVSIAVADELMREELIAELASLDYEGFEEKESELLAFIDEENFSREGLDEIVSRYKVSYDKLMIPEQNWNQLWESNFQPVVVDNFCAIRAEFHSRIADVLHDIVITPKMSFGTGHHATTFMMMKQMSTLDFTGKEVADFGTGTGVLAILAEKLGSKAVWAIDNDDWSIENSKENIDRNNCKVVQIHKAEGFHTDRKFDIVLANINRSILLDNASGLFFGLKEGGQLLLSGLLREDERIILDTFLPQGLRHTETVEKNDWICLLLQHDTKSL